MSLGAQKRTERPSLFHVCALLAGVASEPFTLGWVSLQVSDGAESWGGRRCTAGPRPQLSSLLTLDKVPQLFRLALRLLCSPGWPRTRLLLPETPVYLSLIFNR